MIAARVFRAVVKLTIVIAASPPALKSPMAALATVN